MSCCYCCCCHGTKSPDEEQQNSCCDNRLGERQSHHGYCSCSLGVRMVGRGRWRLDQMGHHPRRMWEHEGLWEHGRLGWCARARRDCCSRDEDYRNGLDQREAETGRRLVHEVQWEESG